MDLRDYLRALRRRWVLIVAVLALSVSAGAVLTLVTEPRYESTAQLFVAVRGNDSVGDLNQGNAFAQSRVASYVILATSPTVLQKVSDASGETVAELRSSLRATSPDKTVLINVRASSLNPALAAQIANATADALVTLVGQLEAVNGESSQPVSLRKVQTAGVPDGPYEPQRTRTLAVAGLLGLAAGVVLALIVDRLDTRLRGRNAIEALTDCSVLGSFRAESGSGEGLLLRSDALYGARAEGFRQLRTHLQFANVDGGVDSVLVTSSIPGEGKSTTAANLAMVLAESGIRTVLVDADLRRPAVASMLGLEGTVGLTTVLTGQVTIADALQPVAGSANLSVLTSGVLPPNPSEILGSAAMERTLRELNRSFGVVIVDSPPLVNVSDPGVLASLVSGVLLVASVDGRLRREQFQQSLQHLSFVKGRVLGIVLNRVATVRGGDRYYGYAAAKDGAAPSNIDVESRAGEARRKGRRAVRTRRMQKSEFPALRQRRTGGSG